ncbi:hydroxypyruvate isomerase family protein [Paenibacillus sp. Soil750]|uniref:hydroxypyruvate isomerase family protein n=1 Tax=Paenibacillus sp. Soil750 TaxID=1736398 RepID=UPI0006F82004|nr:TIM barrel protein [Paenibacillus sp. Soil750]KRE70928.1 glyoxylate-induced protein [Paenibacillus sp. Soil750]
MERGIGMKLSVCMDALYKGRDFRESVNELKEIGYDTIEFWSWWQKDIDVVADAVAEAEISISTFCTKFSSLVDPTQRSVYLEGLVESIAVAKRLNCTKLISQVGQALEGVPREAQTQSLIEGLRACVPILEKEGVTLLIEPLNTRVNHQGYFLASSEEAFHIINQVGSPYVKILFDIYHQQITEGNVIANIRENIGLIGHFHAAGNPGRHELDNGELNYEQIFKAIDETGFEGHMGLEYFPLEAPQVGLRKLLK